MTKKDKERRDGIREEEEETFIVNDGLVVPWKDMTAAADGRDSGEREWGGGVGPAFCSPFHVFWSEKQERKVQRASQLGSKGAGLWISDGRARSANISRFRQLLLNLVRVRLRGWVRGGAGLAPFCILSMVDEPSLHARHCLPDCTSPQRERRLLKVCIFLRLFHSVCCDAGTGGQPCVEIQALYSPRQLLEWVWIYQPVICALPLPTNHPTPSSPPSSSSTTQN